MGDIHHLLHHRMVRLLGILFDRVHPRRSSLRTDGIRVRDGHGSKPHMELDQAMVIERIGLLIAFAGIILVMLAVGDETMMATGVGLLIMGALYDFLIVRYGDE